VVATVARPLHVEALRTRPDALYLPNAVDYGHFANLPERARDPKLAGLREGRPVAGYYGALAKWFDDEMLDETAGRRPDWSFLLVGPMYEGGLRGARSLRRPNVIWTGPRDYRILPGYAAWFDAALIPFRVNKITRATSPLKLYEYFAAGRPVVSTALPECEAFPEVRIVRDSTEFSDALDAAWADSRSPQFVERLRSIGRQNSWQARVETVLACCDGGA
jgi:glycosyltransferase involved in cell wall biosynthesis